MTHPLPIIIPVFNRPKLLHQTISTAIAHSDLPLEIIIIDDHSTQDIAAVVTAIDTTHRLRYYRMPRQLGPGICNTYGIALIRSHHPYFIINGADTYFEPHWHPRLITVAQANPDYALIAPGVTDNSTLDTPPYQTPLVLKDQARMGPSLLIRRDVYSDVGPQPPHKLGVPSEDIELRQNIIQAGYRVAHTQPGVIVHTGLTSVFWNRNNLADSLTRIRAQRPEIYME